MWPLCPMIVFAHGNFAHPNFEGPTLFLKLTRIRQRENGKFVDFNDFTQVWRRPSKKCLQISTNDLYCQKPELLIYISVAPEPSYYVALLLLCFGSMYCISLRFIFRCLLFVFGFDFHFSQISPLNLTVKWNHSEYFSVWQFVVLAVRPKSRTVILQKVT